MIDLFEHNKIAYERAVRWIRSMAGGILNKYAKIR